MTNLNILTTEYSNQSIKFAPIKNIEIANRIKSLLCVLGTQITANRQEVEYNKEVSNFYAEFTKKAYSNLYMIELPMIEEVMKKLGNLEGKVGLDFGCGLGQLAKRYADAGAIMTGIDISEEQLEKARISYPTINFNTNLDSIADYSLDFICCKFSLCEMNTEEYNKNLAQLKKKLKSGGILVIGDHNRDSCSGQETMCEKYATITNEIPGDKVIAILKTPGTKFNETSEEGKDFVRITDHYRPNQRVEESLSKIGATSITVTLPECPKNHIRIPMDEAKNNVYRITVASF